MSQSVVTVRLNGQPYQMGCGPGEEAHIEALAHEVDTILGELKKSAGQLGDARLLAMAALILADQKHNLVQRHAEISAAGPQTADQSIDVGVDTQNIAKVIAEMAAKIRALSAQLEKI